MARDSERIHAATPTQGMSRIEVADMMRPTTQMAPLFGEGTVDESLVIEEHVPAPSGEHPALLSRDSLPQMEVFDLRMSGMQPIDDRVVDAAPVVIDDRASDATLKNRSAATSLGVAPLEPATVVKAPFVVDTPVQRWSPLPAPAQGSTRIPTVTGAEEVRHERTAMIALDPTSGMPRSGPWQALVAVAKSIGGVRWWSRRRKTSRVKPLDR